MSKNKETEKRKAEHINICLKEQVHSQVTSGFERYYFRHLALPEIDFSDIHTDTEFLGRKLKVPFLISSMTGGTRSAHEINLRLAEAAEARGWGIGLGSIRAALENPDLLYSFKVRDRAPSVPILANLGAVQLNYGFGLEECKRAVELLEADGIVFHLNSMQEVFQTEGNTNFKGLLARIEQICRGLEVPVGVKEVGFGIDGATAKRLYETGVAFVDVAGAGGTSWIQVEKFRSNDPLKRNAAEAFQDWGIPTAQCVKEVREAFPDGVLLASGGISNGVEAAKAIALGADLVGVGRSLLGAATDSVKKVEEILTRVEFEFVTVMFGIGVTSIGQLKQTERLCFRS